MIRLIVTVYIFYFDMLSPLEATLMFSSIWFDGLVLWQLKLNINVIYKKSKWKNWHVLRFSSLNWDKQMGYSRSRQSTSQFVTKSKETLALPLQRISICLLIFLIRSIPTSTAVHSSSVNGFVLMGL